MNQVYRFDEDGYYKEPVLIGDDEPIPSDCLEEELPQPNWKPKAVNGKWVETITEEELEEIKNRPEPKSELEVVKEENAALKQQVIQQNIDMQEFMDFILEKIGQ